MYSSYVVSSDFTVTTTTVTLNPGDTKIQVEVEIVDDIVPEINENFFIDLTTSNLPINITTTKDVFTSEVIIIDNDGKFLSASLCMTYMSVRTYITII